VAGKDGMANGDLGKFGRILIAGKPYNLAGNDFLAFVHG
jgi:hypothetical protein